jgi:hypothetical protein
MAATNPIPSDPDAKTSTGVEARKNLGREAARASRPAPARTKSNGNSSIGGRAVSGGAKVRGGAG